VQPQRREPGRDDTFRLVVITSLPELTRAEDLCPDRGAGVGGSGGYAPFAVLAGVAVLLAVLVPVR
jgi:hypothetical protein